MSSVNSYHAAGRAAYTHHTQSSQNGERTKSASSARETTSAQEAPDDTAFPEGAESDLTAQEQEMIEEHFPEDSELSMRLYGRGRDTQTVNPDTVGRNLDVTG